MSEAFEESGLSFGPYQDGQCFRIEKSTCYAKIQKGLKIADFLLLKQQKNGTAIWVIEVKSSSPRPENQPNFAGFIEEICDKLTNWFLLVVAALLQRHPEVEHELPTAFKMFNLQTQGFRFVLVINGHKQSWLEPLQNALVQTFKPIVKAWALPANSVVVLNDELAQQYGLISAVS